jgi:putative transposase
MIDARFPLLLRNFKELIHERGIDVSYETGRFWSNRFGPLFAREICKRRNNHPQNHSNWKSYLDEIFVKINGKTHYFWRAVDHEGEVLEAFVSKRRDRKVALVYSQKIMKRYVKLHVIVTDRLS